ncbi:MAG: V-type ATP synthase subunit A [Candidatus Heimdallarchaeota archaeon]|nr:V-type ATP synthase subunit A [Candidatus Heimdallarchaeota archaeon]MCK5142809.1 V-type ATP synthase subunit A [Candidatus Heimdallarchaeota archaeon]
MPHSAEERARIVTIKGSTVEVRGLSSYRMGEITYVGDEKLIGEVIEIERDFATVQVYEPLEGLKINDPVYPTGKSLSAELGPGLLSNIFDGIQRPLEQIKKLSASSFIQRGIQINALDRHKKWQFEPNKDLTKGHFVKGGDVLGSVQETETIKCNILVPPNTNGELLSIQENGEFKITDPIAELKGSDKKKEELTLMHEWHVRIARPFLKKLPVREPLVTGQRIIDMFFPIAKGGTAAIPGGFGTGKTILQHQLSKWSDADVVIYIGCGERGNEMTDVLRSFPKLVDPHTQNPLMDRTSLIANVSNMPVAAREASIYMGITMAEFYRDQGFNVLLTADSTSRWAEALREIAGQLEEMPVEEGYPAYLGARLANFYERAGQVIALGSPYREGSINITAAVSPPGGDFSEPVTANTKRFVKTFWGLDPNLANRKHFPSINWLNSYSGYIKVIEEWALESGLEDWGRYRQEMFTILQKDDELQHIAELIGSKALPADEQLIILVADIIKEGFLQQNAFDKVDSFCPIEKQMKMMKLMLLFYNRAEVLIRNGCPISLITNLKTVQILKRIKEDVPNDNIIQMNKIEDYIHTDMEELGSKYGYKV